jgi:hypothetical protein
MTSCTQFEGLSVDKAAPHIVHQSARNGNVSYDCWLLKVNACDCDVAEMIDDGGSREIDNEVYRLI